MERRKKESPKQPERRNLILAPNTTPRGAFSSPPTMAEDRSKIWDGSEPTRVAEALQALFPDAFPSASSAKKALSKRSSPVLVNRERPARCQLVARGDTITLLATKPIVARADCATSLESIVAATGPLVVAYLDPALVIVVKPHAMEVTSTLSKNSLYQKLLFCLPPTQAPEPLRRPFPCHRIDKPTYGLLAVARTKEASRTVGAAFNERRVRKRYRAVVHGRFEGKNASGGHIRAGLSGKESHSEWRVVGESWKVGVWEEAPVWLSCLDLFPHTGRQHQLRRHMKIMGHSIVGDDRHGHEESDDRLRKLLEECGDDAHDILPLPMMLAAVEIEFRHKLDTNSGQRDLGIGCVMDASSDASCCYANGLLQVTTGMPSQMKHVIGIRSE